MAEIRANRNGSIAIMMPRLKIKSQGDMSKGPASSGSSHEGAMQAGAALLKQVCDGAAP